MIVLYVYYGFFFLIWSCRVCNGYSFKLFLLRRMSDKLQHLFFVFKTWDFFIS
jgi:hypothetical protein